VISDKLNRQENDVMGAVYTLSGEKERFLAAPYEIAALCKSRYDEERLERILRALETDGYFDFVPSSCKGERVYVIHMRAAGLSYRRSDFQRRRSVVFRWSVAAVGAVITFLVGLLLKTLFR